jgi:choline dehydrogenase-like flavoprotein
VFLDLNRVEPAHFRGRNFDVCVCGGGVAGITLALALAERCSVVLLEGGGREYSYDSQSLYKGRNVGLEYFDLAGTRLRFFGGSSNHWSGWLCPLDPHDFEPAPYAGHPGWPIAAADLDPYLEATRTILDISDERCVGNDPTRNPWHREVEGFREIKIWSSPLRFGPRYAPQIERSARIACYLHANVTDLRLAGDRVANVSIADYSGRRFEVQARSFVLALGGIENPRILLNCNRQRPAGIGNQHDLVGRYFAEHPHLTVGGFLLEDGIRLDKMRIFSPSAQLMRRDETLNFSLRCLPLPERRPEGFKARLRRATCKSDSLKVATETLRGSPIGCDDGWLKVVTEQSGNPDSRVMLGKEVDRFGLRAPVLNWQLNALDKHTMRQAMLRFGQAFAAADCGRVRVAGWLMDESVSFPGLDQELAGHHHMGTTRMAASPRQGVVDSNQKVFGVNNLYIAGSSVFASCGHSNPTFTIVQTSLRLADHLKRLHRAPTLSGSTAARIAPGASAPDR